MRKIFEAKNPLKGNLNSYWGTFEITPTSSSKDIPKNLYKYIRNIRVERPDWKTNPEYFELDKGKILVSYEVPKLEVEYCDIDEERLVKEFEKLGWKVNY